MARMIEGDKPRIKWWVGHDKSHPLWPWSLIGFMPDGSLWAHYLFAVKPTPRQIRRTRNGKCHAVLLVTL